MTLDDKTLQLDIPARTILKVILLLLLVLLLYLLLDIVLVILVSIVIAAAVEPATRWLGRYHLPRVPAVLLVYLATFAILAVLLPFFIFPIVADFSQLLITLPAKIAALPIWENAPTALTAILNQLSFVDLVTGLQQSFSGLPRGVVQTAGWVFGGLLHFVLVVVLSFYLAVQQNGIENFLRLVVPRGQEKYAIDLWHRSQRKIGLWMQGQLLLGLIMGVLVFLGLTILRLDHALVLALFAAIFELIPFFGPVLSAVPAALLGFSTSISLGFLVIGFYIIMQQFENHLIYPLVVKKIVGVPPLLVILALIIGAKLAGFLGVILAVPVATVLAEALDDLEKRRLAVSN